MNNTIKRIEQLLQAEEETPIRDSAGIITAAGIDSAAKVRAIRDCLKIVKEGAREPL